jgi:fructose-1,6-bisphosphatase/sedoheptulose 1,7-bisphosphatase-like protein
MSQCDHKTEVEYGVCNRCQAFAVIARNARLMLQARKRYMDQLLVDPRASDEAQMEMQDRVQNLERSVDFATQSNLWD